MLTALALALALGTAAWRVSWLIHSDFSLASEHPGDLQGVLVHGSEHDALQSAGANGVMAIRVASARTCLWCRIIQSLGWS